MQCYYEKYCWYTVSHDPIQYFTFWPRLQLGAHSAISFQIVICGPFRIIGFDYLYIDFLKLICLKGSLYLW